MKKFLSLVLALVMTMSLVTISAGAKDFTDDKAINYDEAVSVLSAIDVIDGYTDGSFKPATALNRGQAAKIICNLILGPTTAAELSADTAPFSDVPVDHTFAGYIAFCVKEGITSGYADGTYKPAAPLTSYAFMKMLLGALGYDAETEGYVGANWSINVAKRALAIGLDDGLKGDFNGVDTVTREEACLYAFNTLQADMVEYDSKTIVTIGDAEVALSGNLSQVRWLSNPDGKKDTIEEDNLVQFAEKYFPNLKKTDTNADDFGRPAHEWKVKKDIVGIFPEDPDAVYTTAVKGKEVFADLGDDYELEAYFIDGVDAEAYPTEDFELAKTNSKKIGSNGTLIEAYIIEGEGDADDTVRFVEINTYVAIVAADYDEDDEELEIDLVDVYDETEIPDVETVLSIDDLSNIDEFKEDDVVLVTIANDGEEYYVASIELAETFTEAVTTFESDYEEDVDFASTESTVTAGDEYSYSDNFATAIEGFAGEYEIDDEYDFYLDTYGYVIYVDGVEVEAKYVYIDAFEASGVSTKASLKGYAYFVDGSTDLINIKKIDDVKIKGEESIALALGDGDIFNGLFEYSEKDGKYELTTAVVNEVAMVNAIPLEDAVLDEDDKLDMNETLELFADGVRGSKNTVFIVIDDEDEVEVYTGIKNVPDIVEKTEVPNNGDAGFIALTDDDSTLYAKYVFIDLGDTYTTKGRAKGGDVMFLYEDTYAKKGTDSKDEVYHTYKAIVDGEEVKVKFDDSDAAAALTAGLYVGVKYDSETGYACDWTAIVDDTEEGYDYDAFEGGYIEKKGDVITVWTDGEKSDGFYMTDDCEVTFILDEEIKSISWKNVGEEGKYTVDGIWSVLNDDDECTELFIAVSEVEADGE